MRDFNKFLHENISFWNLGTKRDLLKAYRYYETYYPSLLGDFVQGVMTRYGKKKTENKESKTPAKKALVDQSRQQMLDYLIQGE